MDPDDVDRRLAEVERELTAADPGLVRRFRWWERTVGGGSWLSLGAAAAMLIVSAAVVVVGVRWGGWPLTLVTFAVLAMFPMVERWVRRRVLAGSRRRSGRMSFGPRRRGEPPPDDAGTVEW